MVKIFYKWFVFSLIWSFCDRLQAQKDSIPEHIKFYDEAVKLIDSARYDEALPLLKKAIKKKPDYWEAMNKNGFIRIQQKKYNEAKKELDKSLKIAPLNYEALKLKTRALYLNNEFKECKVVLDTAAYVYNQESLDDVEIFYYRALLMFKGKSYKSALDACETATDMNPRYIDVIELKGEIRFAMKDYNYAIKELNEAIKLMPIDKPNHLAYKTRARAKFEVGDFKGAVKDWNVYIDAFPKEEEALISRAAAKINANDNSGAIADLDEAIKINPKNPVSFCYRGTAKGGNKSYLEALKDLDHSIKLKFDYPTAYVNRAAIKMAIRDKRGACEDLEKADSLGSEMAIKLIERYCKR